MAMKQQYRMDCVYVQYSEQVWAELKPSTLANVVDGSDVQEATSFKTCWDDCYLYVRFDCEDHYTLANYTKRDEPLYEEDVVEVFIDEKGDGKRYIELEFSPNEVIFDAMVDNDGRGQIAVDVDWDAEGLEIDVHTAGSERSYLIRFPLRHFERQPQHGTVWRANFYRIDAQPDGSREYQAWSPTGEINYHIPVRFGELHFVRS